MVAYAQWGWHTASAMCNLYSITTNQAAIIALFRVINRYVGNLPPMPGVFPDYPAPVIRNADAGTEMVTMRWGMPPPPSEPGPPVTNIRRTGAAGSSPRTAAVAKGWRRHDDKNCPSFATGLHHLLRAAIC